MKFCIRRTLGPTRARFFAAAVIAVVSICLSSSIFAQDGPAAAAALTEPEAVRQALERRALTDLWQARVDSERAEALDVGAWPNPQVGYSREQTFEEPQSVTEDFVILEQTLPLSGRRGLLAEAARTRAEATRLEARAEGRRVATRVREAFWGALAAQRRVEVLTEWLEQMQSVEDAMIQRVEAGESAPYELDRLRLEIADVRAAISQERAELVRRRAQLAGLMGRAADREQIQPTGDLLPQALPEETELREAIASRPEVAAARKRIEAAQLGIEAASRWWIPEPTLTGGYKSAGVADERFSGFVAGVALDVPLFDQRDGERLEAEAALVRAESRRTLIEQRLTAEALGLAQQTRQLSEAARAYRAEGLERAQKVLDVARQAYDAGEVGILELIDAYRGTLDSKLRLVQLQSQARRKLIELQKNLQMMQDTPSSTPSE